MPTEQEKVAILTKVFDNQQVLISKADAKANIALSIQTFIITTILGASIVFDIFNKVSSLSCFIEISYFALISIFFIISILGIALSIFVFMPRPPQEKEEVSRNGITYYGHIKKYKNSKEYIRAVNETTQELLIIEYACQNYTLSKIVDYKMKYVKYSVAMLFINILLGILLLIFSLIIK